MNDAEKEPEKRIMESLPCLKGGGRAGVPARSEGYKTLRFVLVSGFLYPPVMLDPLA